jgi:hypothetical protein
MDAEEIEKRKLLYEVEDELWKLVKRRAWIIIALGSLIGLGGIVVVVQLVVSRVAEQPLRALEKNLAQAELLAERAKSAAVAASGSADQVTADITSLTVSIQGLRAQAKGVEDQFRLVIERINAEARSAAIRSEKDFAAAQQRISALESLVKRIGQENDATRKATADYAKKIASLEAQIEQEQKRFAENSLYTISIRFAPEKRSIAQQIQARLAALGFKAVVTDVSLKFPPESKGNVLRYPPGSEKKAQEVLAIIRPVVNEVETAKLDIGSLGKLPLGLYSFGGFGPNSMSLELG